MTVTIEYNDDTKVNFENASNFNEHFDKNGSITRISFCISYGEGFSDINIVQNWSSIKSYAITGDLNTRFYWVDHLTDQEINIGDQNE